MSETHLQLMRTVEMPSVPLVVTSSRTGSEREHLLDLTGISREEYDPHSRTTALREPKH